MKALLVVVVALVVALLGGAVLLGGQQRPDGSRTPVPTSTRRAMPRPSSTPADPAIVAAAVVVPRRSAELTMPISGRVVNVPVQENEYVFTGEVLVGVDPETRDTARRVALADVRRAQAAVDRAELAIDQLPPDASLAQREAAAAELRLAEAELELAETALAQAELELEQTELRAPFAGTVAYIGVTVGEHVAAAGPEPIVILGDLSGWFIQTTDLSELDVVRVAVGDRAEVTFDALPGVTVGGTVDRIQVRGTAEPGDVRFDVFIEPDTHHPELRWNMSATVRIRADR